MDVLNASQLDFSWQDKKDCKVAFGQAEKSLVLVLSCCFCLKFTSNLRLVAENVPLYSVKEGREVEESLLAIWLEMEAGNCGFASKVKYLRKEHEMEP